MNTEIRKYQPNDLNDLLDSWESASRLAHPFMANDFFEKERINIPSLYIPNTDTWVVTLDNKVVGFIALIVEDSDKGASCEIGGLFIDPQFHSQGLGQSLVDKTKELYHAISVKVFKENTIGRKFYDRYGFHFIQEVVWEESGDILMELELSVTQTSY